MNNKVTKGNESKKWKEVFMMNLYGVLMPCPPLTQQQNAIKCFYRALLL